jgi:hypothetical protein
MHCPPGRIKNWRDEPGCEDLFPIRREGKAGAVGLLTTKVNACVLPRVRVMKTRLFHPKKTQKFRTKTSNKLEKKVKLFTFSASHPG